MADPVGDIRPHPLSHLAVRVPEWDQYVHVRTLLERHASRESRERLERPADLLDRASPSRSEVLDGKVVPIIELHPARPPAGLQDGPRAPRRRRRRRRSTPSSTPAPAGPDRPAVPEPEQHTEPVLRPARGLHPRQVLSALAVRRADRARRRPASTASSTSTLGASAARLSNGPEPAAEVTEASPARRRLRAWPNRPNRSGGPPPRRRADGALVRSTPAPRPLPVATPGTPASHPSARAVTTPAWSGSRSGNPARLHDQLDRHRRLAY